MLFFSAVVVVGSCKGDDISEEIPDFDPNRKPDSGDGDGEVPSWINQDMPVVLITTENGAAITSKTEYIKGNAQIIDSRAKYSETKVVGGPMQIRGRGNTTWGEPKKPYRIKFDEKVKVLGMDKNRDWVLVSNYCDKSLVRNLIAMEISKQLGFSWTIQLIPVEVYLNNEYIGMYCICPQKEVANHRIDIAEDGMFFELDKSHDDEYHFRSSVCKIPVNIKYPEAPTDSLKKAARDLYKAFETALYGNNFKSETEGYAKYIDVDSFIKYYIIEELSYNIDGKCCKSTFLTKEPGKKLEMYFVWDFDRAFGNCNYFNQYYPQLDNGPTGFHTRDYLSDYIVDGVNYGNYGKGWYFRLFQDPAFVRRVQRMWNENYPFLRTIPSIIDKYVAEMGEEKIARNFERWQILGKYVSPQTKPYPETHAEEIDKLKYYYNTRLVWLNEELNKL